MNPFVDELSLNLLVDGFCQTVWGVACAITILPCLAWVLRRDYARLVKTFALFNVCLFFWSGVGNGTWLYLTENKFSVLDDAPVWTLYYPPVAGMFDHAAGGRDGWELLGHTTFPQLYWLWAATALPVWLLAGMSLTLCVHWFRRPAQII